MTVTVLSTACKGNDTQTGQYIPDAPDYTDPVMWYVSENDKTGNGADVLYFVSTWEADWTTEDGRICHYGDVSSTPNIKAAQRDDDTGVTICYNSVSDIRLHPTDSGRAVRDVHQSGELADGCHPRHPERHYHS